MTKNEAADMLREMFPRGSTVYTLLRHVSKSGMMRHIGVLSLQPKAEGGAVPEPVSILHPNYAVALVLGWKLANGQWDAIKVSGSGMDMGFHLVNGLSYALYQDAHALRHRWL